MSAKGGYRGCVETTHPRAATGEEAMTGETARPQVLEVGPNTFAVTGLGHPDLIRVNAGIYQYTKGIPRQVNNLC